MHTWLWGRREWWKQQRSLGGVWRWWIISEDEDEEEWNRIAICMVGCTAALLSVATIEGGGGNRHRNAHVTPVPCIANKVSTNNFSPLETSQKGQEGISISFYNVARFWVRDLRHVCIISCANQLLLEYLMETKKLSFSYDLISRVSSMLH